jgi:hypothetical protein
VYNAEFDAFKQTLTDLCVSVNRPVNDDLVRVFWDDLRGCSLHQIQEHAKRLRREGKTRFTAGDLRETPRAANTFEPPSKAYDHFHRFGQRQFFKFLWTHDTTPAQLPRLIERKNEIINSARNDPEMQPGGDEEEQGKELHQILFAAWRKVIAA